MLFIYNVFAFIAIIHILFVKGQLGPQLVAVGLQGSFYSPETVSVAVNGSITFEFFGDVHSVTQSDPSDPCFPLEGGFHSGFLGMGPNNSEPVKVWNLVVTNVSAPIWYFCAVTNPTFHCSVGMVGAINPPSQAAFSSFSMAAKLVTTTPMIDPTPTLTGIGAFATDTPTVSALSVTPTPSLTSQPSSTLTSTSSPSPTTAPSTNSNLGAIVGGSVAAGIGLIASIFLLWFCCIRKKQPLAPDKSDDFFQYNPTPVRRPSEAFVEAIRNENPNPNSILMSNSNTSPNATLTPLRRPSGPILSESPYLHRPDLASTSSNPTTSRRNVAEQPSNTDIRALAQEVAAVLYENPVLPATNYSQVPQMSADYAPSTSPEAPPNYHTATGAS